MPACLRPTGYRPSGNAPSCVPTCPKIGAAPRRCPTAGVQARSRRERILIRVLHPGLFMQDHPSDLRERCTVADRYGPLGSDVMWTKLRQRRTGSSPMLTASVPAPRPPQRAAWRRRVDRVVGQALQMAGGTSPGR